MSISNLPGTAGLDVVASASASKLSAGVKAVGINNITFTSKTGAYKATWTAPGGLGGAGAYDLDIVIPWTPDELDARGFTYCAIPTGDNAGQQVITTLTTIAADAGGSKIEFRAYSPAALADLPFVIRFSIC
jgi:hypothetical protein